jgi:glutaredoxin-related protein
LCQFLKGRLKKEKCGFCEDVLDLFPKRRREAEFPIFFCTIAPPVAP